MNGRILERIAVYVALASVAVSGPALAQQPEKVRHYRFVPKHSVLTQGWLDREAPDILIPIAGTFDLVTGQVADQDPWVGQYARFENVKAGGPHPIQDVMVDLDEALNLSGLTGRQLPVAGPFDAFEFLGKNSVGHDVWLYATLIGQWFLLNGETTPTPESSDPRYYAIHAVARERPFADFNDDGVVSGGDLAAWSEHFGATDMPSDATALGDADGDGDADGSDLLAWQRIVGEQAPGGGGALANGTAIPEPRSAVIAAMATAALRLKLLSVYRLRRSTRRAARVLI
jgi:hypothetical protein